MHNEDLNYEEFKEFNEEKYEAYNALISMIDSCLEHSKINPTSCNYPKLQQYSSLYKKVLEYFGDIAKCILVDNPKQFFQCHAIIAKFETFELFPQKIHEMANFIELLKLSDQVIFTGENEDLFRVSFFVNSIWEV